MRPTSYGHPDRNMVWTTPTEGFPSPSSETALRSLSVLDVEGGREGGGGDCKFVLDFIAEEDEFSRGLSFFSYFECTFFMGGGFCFSL